MKKFVFRGIIFASTLSIAVIATSLYYLPLASIIIPDKIGEIRLPQAPEKAPEKLSSAPANPADVAVIKKYAESYEPRYTRDGVSPSAPVPDEKVLRAIANLANAQSREHEKYVILIFLRFSRFEYEHFHQHYDLGRDGLLLLEFYRLIGRANYQKVEINLSSLVDDYIGAHPELLKYHLIKKEWSRCDKVDEEIDRMSAETEKESEKRNNK